MGPLVCGLPIMLKGGRSTEFLMHFGISFVFLGEFIIFFVMEMIETWCLVTWSEILREISCLKCIK